MSKLIMTCQHWFLLKDKKPPTTTCLFTDGVSFYAGWWSNSEQCIFHYANGRNYKLDKKVTHWTHLDNLVAQIEEQPHD